jgi:hypothetical protein
MKDKEGKIMEQAITIEKDETMKVFRADGKGLPAQALMGWPRIEALINSYLSK